MLRAWLVCSRPASHLHYDLMLPSRWHFLCLHPDASSFLLFRVAVCGLHIIKYFSVRQRLNFLLMVEYALDFVINFHSLHGGSYCLLDSKHVGLMPLHF